MLSVFWATVVDVRASASSTRATRAMVPRKARSRRAARTDRWQMLNVAATCAAAGIIVGVVDQDRPGPQVQRDRHRLRRRQPAADRALHGADRVDRRPRGAGDGELHHLRGHRGARADQARRAGLRRAHVHLLLRGAVRSLAADRAVAVRGGGDHRRRSVQDDAAVRGNTRCRRSSCRSCSCSTRRGSRCC